MPATNFTPIQLYRTNTASTTAPSAGNLNAGELAINYNDGGMILFAKNTTGTVIKLMNNPASLLYPTADGTNGQTIRTNGSGTLSFGTLGVAGGGTGATTLTANNVILGNGTSAVQFVAPGTNGNVLTSNGTTWVSAAAGASLSGVTDSASPFETSLGYQAGNVSTGVNNTFIGYQAGLVTTTGTNNTAVGFKALDSNSTGSQNVAIGSNALQANTTGSGNIAFGYQALQANTTGNSNVAIGDSAAYSNTTGSSNVAIGNSALFSNTGGDYNVAIGEQALNSCTTGSHNTAVGKQCLYSLTTGRFNTAVGRDALLSQTTAQYNSAFGSYALRLNTTGQQNTAFGFTALGNNTTGEANTAFGYQALQANTTSYSNVAVGADALYNNTTADNNVAIGSSALYANTTGANNTAIGHQAGNVITTGAGNVIVGYNTDPSAAGGVDQIVIGNGVTGQANTNVTIGNTAGKIYNAYTVNATWTQTSDGTMKNIIGPDTLGLSFIKRLNPIRFTWKPQNELPTDHPYYNEVNGRDTNAVIHGFVAQEVKAALDAEGCATFNGWDQGSDGIQAISREMFVSPLVKAIQELAAQVEALQARINVLEGN
jgi:hypothetical protein